jgi:hypothetical protein
MHVEALHSAVTVERVGAVSAIAMSPVASVGRYSVTTAIQSMNVPAVVANMYAAIVAMPRNARNAVIFASTVTTVSRPPSVHHVQIKSANLVRILCLVLFANRSTVVHVWSSL